MKISLASPFDLDNPAEVAVRYCPGCGSVGDVPQTYLLCCSTYPHPVYLPLAEAQDRREEFLRKLPTTGLYDIGDTTFNGVLCRTSITACTYPKCRCDNKSA